MFIDYSLCDQESGETIESKMDTVPADNRLEAERGLNLTVTEINLCFQTVISAMIENSQPAMRKPTRSPTHRLRGQEI